MEYRFDCPTQYLKSECSEEVGYIVEQLRYVRHRMSFYRGTTYHFVYHTDNYSLIMTFLVIFQQLILATFERFFKDYPNFSECNKTVSK